MGKVLRRYSQAWKMRQQGKTLKEIGNEMGFTVERARVLVRYVDFILKNKNNKDYKKLYGLTKGE